MIADASARRVLTTEWIDGERLDRTSAPEDVPRLASLAMNAYMTMMLDTGVLHCDPHPGNLLRTADGEPRILGLKPSSSLLTGPTQPAPSALLHATGRLCILDWGLVTELDEELQLTLIEHVAHITARDYAKLPADLVRLGFVPADQVSAFS